jgi:hypothetical protein
MRGAALFITVAAVVISAAGNMYGTPRSVYPITAWVNLLSKCGLWRVYYNIAANILWI